MGIKYLWDTNTVIYYLQQQFPVSAERFMDDTLSESQPAVSVITEIELLCWKAPTEEDASVLRSFITDAWVFGLERDIKDQTAELRQNHKIKLPDAIIAATALVHSLTLLSRNTKDFAKVNGLSLINPHEQ